MLASVGDLKAVFNGSFKTGKFKRDVDPRVKKMQKPQKKGTQK
jgi:hypothetical protein